MSDDAIMGRIIGLMGNLCSKYGMDACDGLRIIVSPRTFEQIRFDANKGELGRVTVDDPVVPIKKLYVNTQFGRLIIERGE